mmetsp:Transcript_14952/g.22395  ORF Transcript_14952/g.22395 Transcript_14952/m.22395 type:complete len:99 (-) Transcript_14952:18-314(-)
MMLSIFVEKNLENCQQQNLTQRLGDFDLEIEYFNHSNTVSTTFNFRLIDSFVHNLNSIQIWWHTQQELGGSRSYGTIYDADLQRSVSFPSQNRFEEEW